MPSTYAHVSLKVGPFLLAVAGGGRVRAVTLVSRAIPLVSVTVRASTRPFAIVQLDRRAACGAGRRSRPVTQSDAVAASDPRVHAEVGHLEQGDGAAAARLRLSRPGAGHLHGKQRRRSGALDSPARPADPEEANPVAGPRTGSAATRRAEVAATTRSSAIRSARGTPPPANREPGATTRAYRRSRR